eukprot:344445_1
MDDELGDHKMDDNNKENPSLCYRLLYAAKIRKTIFPEIPDSSFDNSNNLCFCTMCHRKRGDKDVYSRGKPSKQYAVPIGWTRLGLKTDTSKCEMNNVWQEWHVGFHGTKKEIVPQIFKAGLQLLKPGDITIDGAKLAIRSGHIKKPFKRYNNYTKKYEMFDPNQIYVSPSIKYASYNAYSSWFDCSKLMNESIKIKIAFQLRIKPNAYGIGQETVNATKHNKIIDTHFDNSELEWYTKQNLGIILTGLLFNIHIDIGKYPQYWHNNIKYGEYALINISLKSSIAKPVISLFNKTMKNQNYKVVKIESIQNKMLYDRWNNTRHMLLKLKDNDNKKVNIQPLWAGTCREKIMPIIMKEGFRKMFNRTAMYGQGSYFTVGSYEMRCYASKNNDGVYKFFLCAVICGESTEGHPKYIHTKWPTNPSTGLKYDSLVVNTQSKPYMFVLGDDDRSYPLFVVSFKECKTDSNDKNISRYHDAIIPTLNVINKVQYPKYWNVNKIKYGDYKLINIPLNNEIAKDVIKLFNKTIQCYKIIKIESVQNQMLYDRLCREKEILLKLLNYNNN